MLPWAVQAVAAAWEERVIWADSGEEDSDHCDPEHRGEAPASYPGVQGVQDGQGVRDDQVVLLASYLDDPGDLAFVSASPSLG